MKKKIFAVLMVIVVLSANIVSAFALPENSREATSDLQTGKTKEGRTVLFQTRANAVKHVKYRSLGSAYKVRHNWCDKNGDLVVTEFPDGEISQIKTKENGLVLCSEGGYVIRADGSDFSQESTNDWNDDSRGWNKVTYTVNNVGVDNSIANKIYRIAPKYGTGNSNKNWAFLQMAVWQAMPRSYNHAEGKANNGQFFTTFTNQATRNEYNSWKAELYKELNVWNTTPSFAKNPISIKAGEKKTLTDSTGSMQYFVGFNFTKAGVTVSHKFGSNTITVSAAAGADFPSVKMTGPELANAGCVKYPDNGAVGTVNYTSSRAQNLKMVRGKVSPVQLSLSFNVAIKGKLGLEKRIASDENLVKINGYQYNLAGAEYSVYTDNACKHFVGKFTTTAQKTDGNGKLYASTNSIELSPGTYYVKETKAPKGYKKDSLIRKAIVTGGKTNILKVNERPMFDPLTLTLKKHVPGSIKGSEKYLKGAEYTVRYYRQYFNRTELQGKTPFRTWVFRTDSDGMFLIDTPWFVRGDSLFKQSDGTVVGLYGTYTFEETKAPKGFIKNSGFSMRQIKQGIAPPHIDDKNHGDIINVAEEQPDNNINRKIVAVKKISEDNVYNPYGRPTAIFKLEGTDLFGKKTVYYKSVTLRPDSFSAGYYIGEVTFDNLPAGNYVLSEVKTSRYNLKSITTNTANAVRSGSKVNIELVNSVTGKATYENEIQRWNNYSHMECIVNRF